MFLVTVFPTLAAAQEALDAFYAEFPPIPACNINRSQGRFGMIRETPKGFGVIMRDGTITWSL